MPDTPSIDGEALLAAVDSAFWQVFRGRFGGRIELASANGDDGQSMRMLRVGSSEDAVRLILQPSGFRAADIQDGGSLVGVVSIAGAEVEDVAIRTEIFDDCDAVEPLDGSALVGGVVFARLPSRLPGGEAAGGLGVLRSREAAAVGSQQRSRGQRGWLPQAQRHNISRALGLSANGHRRAPAASILLPVSADLLARLGGAVATLGLGAQASSLAVVVRTVDDAGA